jgi:predicted RND superfamily exporter protein
MGWKLDLMFIMLPNLLIAVGVADAVHIITEYRTYWIELGDRREAAGRALALLGPPCLLTSLTTAAGFGAMSVAPIKAISHFAVYSAVGVIAAFLLSVTLLFVFLSFGARVPKRAVTDVDRLRAKGGAWMQGGLAAVARFVVRRRRAILGVSLVIFVVSMAGLAQLRVDSVFLHEFRADDPIRVATEYVDEVMGGTASVVYLFDAGEDGGAKEPAVLREIERFQGQADTRSGIVRKTSSVVDLLKDINQTFHDGDPTYAAVPETRDLAAQYLLVYEMSGGEELHDYVSMDLARANIEVRTTSAASSEFWNLVTGLDGYMDADPIESSQVTVTGMGALWLRLMEYITWSQIRGFLLAFSVIAVLLCAIFRSVKIGLIAMVPNLAPVILTLGAMGWADLPLDYIRLLIASVAIGISVDDTIHLLMRMIHEFRERGRYEEAFHATMSDVGRALFVTSVVLACGFLVMLLSTMDSLSRFGVLLAGTVVTALVADFLVLPALILTLKPLGPERGDGVSDHVPGSSTLRVMPA